MPTRYIVRSNRQAALVERRDAEVRLRAMRDAVEAGIADIEAGRYRVFDTADALREGLAALADEAICGATPSEDRT